MGIIIAKFRKKKTTLELLEELENEIKSIETFRRDTEQTQKKMVGRFVFISVCLYCVSAFILYFYFFPASLYDRIIYVTPLLVMPLLLIFIKRGLSWYYSRKITKNQKKLSSLKDEKKKILDDVMDKETYKIAKTILEKYAPEQVRKPQTPIQTTPIRPTTSTGQFGSAAQSLTNLRYRGPLGPIQPLVTIKGPSYGTPVITSSSPAALMPPPTPALNARVSTLSQTLVPSSVGRPGVPGTPMLLPRAILPRDRSVLDKMVDYLVGDGPSNRYALICKNCSSHNGMALKEEFDYLSFRCCYCATFNPSRKKRPSAPKLDTTFTITSQRPSDSTDSDKESGDSDSDSTGPIITESKGDSLNLIKSEKVNTSDQHSDSEKLLSEFEKISDTEKDSSPMDIDMSFGETCAQPTSKSEKPKED